MKLADRLERFTLRGIGCWGWTGATRNGYGVLGRGEMVVYAHRLSWELANGLIPEDMCILHRCDNRTCTNPDHLWLGTKTDNNRDMAAKGRHVGNRRLTVDQVREIRRSSDRAVALADRFGVSVWNIYNVRSGRIWAGVR